MKAHSITKHNLHKTVIFVSLVLLCGGITKLYAKSKTRKSNSSHTESSEASEAQRLRIVMSETTLASFKKLSGLKSWAQVMSFGIKNDISTPDDVKMRLLEVLSPSFSRISIANNSSENDNRGGGLTMMFDLRIKFPIMSPCDNTAQITGTFTDASKNVVQIVNGSGTSHRPYGSFSSHFPEALTGAFNEFSNNLRSSAKLIAASTGGKSKGGESHATVEQNPFDGTWVGKCDLPEQPKNLELTLLVTGRGTRIDVNWRGGGRHNSFTVNKATSDGGTLRFNYDAWTLTPNSDGKTAHFTCDVDANIFGIGAFHSSAVLQRVSPPSSNLGSPVASTVDKSKKVEASGEELATLSSAHRSKGKAKSDASLESSYGTSLDKAEALLEGKGDSAQNDTPKGIYAMEKDYTFNVLDSVYYDPAKDQLSLIGHFDNRFSKRKIPYLQHLATLLENNEPEFTLIWTPESEKRMEGLFTHHMSQSEADSITETMGKLYDEDGNLTKVGGYLIPALGISPISDKGGVPGSMGMEVVQEPGTHYVKVSKLLPNSTAAAAGIQVGDVIETINESPPFSPAEFEHFIRMKGAGSAWGLHYRRNGKKTYAVVKLAESDDPNVWKGAKTEDVEAALYFKAGNNKAAQCIRIVGMVGRLKEKYHASDDELRTLQEQEIYMEDLLPDLAAIRKSGFTKQAGAEFVGKWCQARDRVFDFGGTPLTDAYNGAQSRGEGAYVIGAAVEKEFKLQLKAKNKELLNFAFEKPEGFQIPPELVEDQFHIHPEMIPKYLGVDKHSLLARAMFSSDYLCKRLMNRPELNQTIPNYQTAFEFEAKHPEFRHTTGNYRIWISIDKMDTPQSPSGKTLAFQDVKMKFNIREESGRASDNSGKDLPNKSGGYEELLTSLWDNLEQEYPTLHELKETAKIADAAEWILTKNPSASLPKEGRVSWQGPSKVPGLVFFELQPDSSKATKTKVTIIAEGGDSLKRHHPESGHLTPFPINSAVLDAPVLDENTGKAGTNTQEQLMTVHFHSTQGIGAASEEEASVQAGKVFDDTRGVKSQGKIDTSGVKTPTSADMRISEVPPKYKGNRKIMGYDSQAKEWLAKSDKLEIEVEQLTEKRKTANDGGKTEVELSEKLNKKLAADSQWRSAEINKKEAIRLEDTKIEK